MAKRLWKILHAEPLPEAAGTWSHRSEIRSSLRAHWRSQGHPTAEVKHAVRTVRAFGASLRVSILVVRARIPAVEMRTLALGDRCTIPESEDPKAIWEVSPPEERDRLVQLKCVHGGQRTRVGSGRAESPRSLALRIKG